MEKINKILIGTHNLGKFREISSLLPKRLVKLSPTNLNISEPKETGKSFKENSILKAKYFYKKTGIPTISDDSGLEVYCLNNKPGIHSARWAKKQGGFYKAMQKIIKEVTKKNKVIRKKNWNARFICSLTFINNKGNAISANGVIKGTIAKKIKGTNGFGYDSIFVPLNKKLTFGEMKKKNKMKIDHRYIAYQNLKKKLKFFK